MGVTVDEAGAFGDTDDGGGEIIVAVVMTDEHSGRVVCSLGVFSWWFSRLGEHFEVVAVGVVIDGGAGDMARGFSSLPPGSTETGSWVAVEITCPYGIDSADSFRSLGVQTN